MTLLESTGIPAVFADSDLRLFTFSAAASAIFAITPADLGRSITDLTPRLNGVCIAAEAQGVLRSRAAVLREATSPEGKVYEVRVAPCVLPQPDRSGVVITLTDVTTHRLVSEEARSYAAMVRSSGEAVIVSSLDGRILTWNHGAERLFGFSAAEAAAPGVAESIVPEVARPQQHIVRERLGRGETVEPFEARRLTRDGRTIDVLINTAAIVDQPGRVVAVVETMSDISERKRAEENLREAYANIGLQFEQRGTQLAQAVETVNAELANRLRVEQALRESKERIKAILNTATEGIISINRQGVIDTFNPAAERLFGYVASEVIGKDVSILMPPSVGAEHAGYLSRYIRTGEKRVIGIGREVEGKRKDGSTFPLELAVGEGADGDGPIFVGILRDLTTRKESENLLRTAERLAAIGTLAAGLGHDMNNVLLPVRARLNALRAAADAGVVRPKEQRHALAISRSVAYLQQLADGLHFLAMDPEGTEGGQAGTDLHRWWRQAGALLTKSVAEHVTFSASIPTGLPAVGVAPHQLTQALLNLLVNANEATPLSGLRRKGRIRVWAKAGKDEAVGPCVRLGVTDNGRGMPEDVRKRAFDMFFTTKPRGMGTGLGLPLVRKIVSSVGGAVQIDSIEGKGTTVTMVFPARPGRPRGAARGTSRPSAVISIADGRAAALLGQMLEADGVSVTTDEKPVRHTIWVVEPSADRLPWVTQWKARCPGGRLVLFGEPDTLSRANWMKCHPIVVHDRYDLKQIRAALKLVVGGR